MRVLPLVAAFALLLPASGGTMPEVASRAAGLPSGRAGAPPVTLGRAVYDFDGDGREDRLSLVWIGGRHFVDEELWAGAGEKYTGQFAFRVEFANGVTVTTTLESLGLDDAWDFFRAYVDQPWRIELADYNRDGQIDFNVGSYGASTYSIFRLFTVSPAGRIVSLPTEGDGSLTFGPPNMNSTDEFHLTATGFFYDDFRAQTQENSRVSLDWDASKRIFRVHERRL